MDLKEIYKSKLISAEEAVKHIKNGNRVVTGHAAAEPTCLVNAMVDNYKNYKNVEVCHVVTIGEARYTLPEMKGHFIFNGLFVSGATRAAVNSGQAVYTPSFFHEIPDLFRNELPVDVALIMVSKPDEHGYCSFGPSNDYTKPVSECAKIVIAQINESMPRVLGKNFINIKDIDYIVEHDAPMAVYNQAQAGEIEGKIGEYCASLIKDGDVLQLGIGAIPDAVLGFLTDRKDLGLHSEMVSDGVIDLIEKGVITNKKKNFNNGLSIITFIMGSQKLYDYIDNNPIISMHPVDYVNNPIIISQNDNMVSINSCIQVDFTGQVASESIGPRQFSGVGGQVDFVRGAAMSKGGRSIIAMPSTASKGKISRITPFLDQGAAVTTSRNDVNYVVTEYGIAKLKGKNLKERARTLINIAHPDFRSGLMSEFETLYNEKF